MNQDIRISFQIYCLLVIKPFQFKFILQTRTLKASLLLKLTVRFLILFFFITLEDNVTGIPTINHLDN